MSASDAKKASYFFASFLTSFLFLFNLQVPSIQKSHRTRREVTRTSLNHPRTCTPSQSASHDRCLLHQLGYRLTCAGGAHWAACAGFSTLNDSKTHRKNPLDCARETLVALRVIVFQTNLELDSLHEVAALLAGRLGKQLLDRAPHA
jgi:hypothetical protein